jgi:transposase
MDRDFEAKKYKYSANSYIEVLDAKIGLAFEELNNPSYIFMQDNASIHTTHKVKDWFRNAGIKILPWPLYSLDLNLIEHVWKKLKEIIDFYFLEISRSTGDSEVDLERLGSVI